MEIISTLFILLVMAAIVQFTVDRLKAIIPEVALRIFGPPVWSLAVALALAFMFNLDMFAALGFQSDINILPKIFTALAISAGADPLHNLFSYIRELRTEIKGE